MKNGYMYKKNKGVLTPPKKPIYQNVGKDVPDVMDTSMMDYNNDVPYVLSNKKKMRY